MRPVQSPTRRSFEVVADDRPERRRRPNPNAEGRRGQPEHFMPDLEDPAAPGTRMQPKFFLTSAELPFGTPDAERRGAVAEWMTENPWFATALVNRMWAELVGEGFYEPIDDIGPDRTAIGPEDGRVLEPPLRRERLRREVAVPRDLRHRGLPAREPAAPRGRTARRSSPTSPSRCGAISCTTPC